MNDENLKPDDRVELTVRPRWRSSSVEGSIILNGIKLGSFLYFSRAAPFTLLQIFALEPYGHKAEDLAVRVCDPGKALDPEDRREQLYKAIFKINKHLKHSEIKLIKKESGLYVFTLPIFLITDLSVVRDPNEFLTDDELLIP